MSNFIVKNKVKTAIFSFSLAAVCLIGSTYAWFSIASEAQVDDMSMTLGSMGDIYLGLKVPNQTVADKYHLDVGDTYYPADGNITQSLLVEFGQLSLDTELISMTSCYDNVWLEDSSIPDDEKFPIFNQLPTKADIHGKNTIDTKFRNKLYYQFELYVKSSKDMFIYVDSSTSILPDENLNRQVARNSSDVTADELNKTVEALRVSYYTDDNYFIYEPYPDYDNGERVKEAYFGKLDAVPHDGYYDIDLDYNEILFGAYENEDKIVYDESGRDKNYRQYDGNEMMLAESHDKASCIDIEKSLENGVVGKFENAYTLEEISGKHADVDEEFALFYLTGMENTEVDQIDEKRLVVSIWVEGWDENSAVYSNSSNFLINLAFGGKTLRE